MKKYQQNAAADYIQSIGWNWEIKESRPRRKLFNDTEFQLLRPNVTVYHS